MTINNEQNQPKNILKVKDLSFYYGDFQALKDVIDIKVGQNSIVKFEGRNLSNKTITAMSNFIALPEKIIPYLIKTECFCFTKQTLAPGESQIFTMVFFLDPSLDLDLSLIHI